ncbi:hypothetical protein A2U01_0015383 [Trifolium medium]|uniref:Retrovirus-related Pol polyprotein from transposon TNT 1-94 n=1 Tax=Trifolium medium TaxID=97028 RepID=A0A392N4C3_9FABA|nr:hypothetical protein [Trifolium medium]
MAENSDFFETIDSQIRWILRSLGDVDGKPPSIQGILELDRERSHGCASQCNGGATKNCNESKLTDLKVKNYLFQSIDRLILETILVRDTARDIWNAMRTEYQGSTKVKRAQLQALHREFEILAMGESETVDESLQEP